MMDYPSGPTNEKLAPPPNEPVPDSIINIDPDATSKLTITTTSASRNSRPISLNLTAVGPSPTLKNFRTFKPPDMSKILPGSGDDDGFSASLLSSYFSEGYKKFVMRRGFVTTSAMPESSKRQLGSVRPFGKGPDNPRYTSSLESYSKGELFVEPVWMGSASRSLSRSGKGEVKSTSKSKDRMKRLMGTTPTRTPTGTPARPNTASLVDASDNSSAINSITMLPMDGNIGISPFGSFTEGGKSLFTDTGSLFLGGAPPRPKTSGSSNISFKYSVVKSRPLSPKKKAFPDSPILARLSNPNGDMALEMKRLKEKKKKKEEEEEQKKGGGDEDVKNKTKKRKKVRKRKVTKKVGEKLKTDSMTVEVGQDEEITEEDLRLRKEIEVELKEERLAAHQRKQREAASILRQQAMWAGIANLMKWNEQEISKRKDKGQVTRETATLAQEMTRTAIEDSTNTIENLSINSAFKEARSAMIECGGGGKGPQEKQSLTLIDNQGDTGGLRFVLGGETSLAEDRESKLNALSTAEKARKMKEELKATGGATTQ